MKKIYSLRIQAGKFAPPKLRRDRSQRLIHGLLNQLTVINLCSFQVRRRRGGNDVANYDTELSNIEAAVAEASELAEGLKNIWDQPVTRPRTRHGGGLKKAHSSKVRLKIVAARAVGIAPFGD